jgi:hypothetical protein
MTPLPEPRVAEGGDCSSSMKMTPLPERLIGLLREATAARVRESDSLANWRFLAYREQGDSVWL